MAHKKSTFKEDLKQFIKDNQPVTINKMIIKFPHKTKKQIVSGIGNLTSKDNIAFIRSRNKKGDKTYSIIGKGPKVEKVDEPDKPDLRKNRPTLTLSQLAATLENKNETAINGLELFKENLDLMLLDVHGLLEKIRD